MASNPDNQISHAEIFMNLRAVVCLPAIAIIFASPAQAKEDQKKITLGDYVQHVAEHSPEAANIMADTLRSEADVVESIQWNNPEIQIDSTVAKDNAGRDLEIEVEQPLRGSDFGARLGFAQAVQTLKEPEQKARLLDLSHQATRAYMDLWLAQEKVNLLSRIVKDAKRQSKTVIDAAAQGLTDKAESSIFTTEAEELTLQRSALAAEYKRFLIAFVRLSGLSSGNYVLAKPEQKILPKSAGELLSLSENESSVKAILSGRQNVASQRMAVAKADAALPEVTPRAVLNRNFSEDSTAMSFGVRFALPVWSQNQPEILRAKADYQSTSAALQALSENDFPSVLALAWETAKENQKIADKYEKVVVPSWRNVQKLTENKLGQGQASVFDLWKIRARVLESEMQALESRRSAVESVLSLENLSGTAFSDSIVKGDK
ncbi:MAG: TolC family protein [Alphaproteobacteria bacterium]|nr:TolC family protein [Alphaproteobacteria bacterium]QQS57900.1 MAG: TolC family protein [Alphaproteobacteria bacterium]